MLTHAEELNIIQKIKNRYGLSKGMRVTNIIYSSYGTGIIDGFEMMQDKVVVRVKWKDTNSFHPKSSKGCNISVHGPTILRKIDNLYDCRSNPNQSFRVYKYSLNKDK